MAQWQPPPESRIDPGSATAAAVLAWQPPPEARIEAPAPGDIANVIRARNAPANATINDYVTQILHGLGRGAAAIPGIAGDIPTLAGRGAEWLGSKIAPETTSAIAGAVRPVTSIVTPPTSNQTVGFAERNLIGERPEPKSGGARFAGNVAQYVPASLIPAGGAANFAKQGLLGAASGVSAEGARELGLPPIAQIIAGALPGLVTSGANVLSGRTGAAGHVRQAFKETTPAEFEAGAARQAAGRAIGVPLMGQEALAPEVGGGPIGNLASGIMTTPAGAPRIAKVFESRPAAITGAAKAATEKLGPSATADQVLTSVKSTAQRTIDAFERNRTLRTSKLYTAGDPVRIPSDAVTPILDKVNVALAAAPSEGALTSELKSLQRKLTATGGTPQVVSSALNTTKKELEQRIRPALGLDAGGDLRSHAGIIGPIVRDIRDTLHANNSYYARADDLYAKLTGEMQSVIGTADNPSWIRRVADAKSNSQLRNFLLDPENMSPDTIRNVADMFRGQNRLQDLGAFMRHALENDFNSAGRQLQSGANPAMGVKFGNAVYGTEKQRALMSTYWDQIDPTGGAGRGLETFFKVTDRTGRTPGMGSPTATRLALNEQLSGGPASTAAQLGAGAIMAATGIPAGQLAGGYLISSSILNQIRRAYLNLGAAKIARLLTDPDSVGKLRALAKKDPASPAAAASVLSLLGGRASSEE